MTTEHTRTKPFLSDDDFWRVRDRLIETYPLTPTYFNWEIRRWDGWSTWCTTCARRAMWTRTA